MVKTWSMHHFSAYANNWSLPSSQAKLELQLKCGQRCLLLTRHYPFVLLLVQSLQPLHSVDRVSEEIVLNYTEIINALSEMWQCRLLICHTRSMDVVRHNRLQGLSTALFSVKAKVSELRDLLSFLVPL